MASSKSEAGMFELEPWPANVAFPLSDADCVALCHGYAVKFDGTVDQVMDLPGRYELINGWLMLKR